MDWISIFLIGIGNSTSSFRVTNSLLRRAWSANSIKLSRLLFCLILEAFSNRLSKLSYSLISNDAVLIPIPGTPGILSTESPANDWTSMTLFGSTPNFSITSFFLIKRFFIVSSIDTSSFTSCIKSLSDETIVTFIFSSTAAFA